jgi:hypothetical protein
VVCGSEWCLDAWLLRDPGLAWWLLHMYSIYGTIHDGINSFFILNHVVFCVSLQDFFQAAESQGIKMSTIERGIKQLKGVIALYRETTG